MPADDTATIDVEVVFSPRAGVVDESRLKLLADATVDDAIAASGLATRYPAFRFDALGVGVWGERCVRSRRLREADRVEVYRPLLIDPMDARRRRQAGQRAAAPPTRAKPTR